MSFFALDGTSVRRDLTDALTPIPGSSPLNEEFETLHVTFEQGESPGKSGKGLSVSFIVF